MFRSHSDDIMSGVHMDSLRELFAVVVVVSDADTKVIRVDRPHPRGGGVVSAMVTLAADFPRSAPVVRTLGGREVSIAEAGAGPSGASSSPGLWDPTASLLGIAVGNAMTNLLALLGDVVPPSVESILPSIGALSDEVLLDLASNPLCMECFAYQLPYAKKAREEAKANATALEQMALGNLRCKASIEQMQGDVRATQLRLQQSLRTVQDVKESPQFRDTCTTAGVTRVVDSFIKQATAEANADAERVLACSLPSDRDGFETALNAFIDHRRQVHEADLKKRSLLQTRPY